jgi:hypothetical protein
MSDAEWGPAVASSSAKLAVWNCTTYGPDTPVVYWTDGCGAATGFPVKRKRDADAISPAAQLEPKWLRNYKNTFTGKIGK